MKKYYSIFLLLLTPLISSSQSNCDDANSYLVNAYSHVKDAYDSNNIDHLKYYANRSLESFKLSKKTLNNCNCQIALDLTDKGIGLLEKVETANTYEDGRFYVKRARDVAKESVIEIDKCSMADYVANTSDTTIQEDHTLTEIQKEQLKLQKQQEALKLREAQIKTQLAQQKEKELILRKEQLILSYKNVMQRNVEIYNETLKICDCQHNPITVIQSNEDMLTKSIDDIKKHYNKNLKTLASNYLEQLNSED